MRVLGMRHYDVQLIGGMVLHAGRIAEMRTGEGKTLVATLPCYLNALDGKGVHVVTVNDYLAQRDAEWMGRVHDFLGLTVGRDRPRPRRLRAPEAGLRLRHHLRPEQRVRLRLPARQHEVLARTHSPARPQLRDRRRGRLHPHRRGAHAAHHLAARARQQPTSTSRSSEIDARAFASDERLHRRREGPLGRCSPTSGIEKAERMLSQRGLTEVDNLYEPVNMQTLHITCSRRCAPTRSTSATQTTWSRRRQGPHHRRVHRPQMPGRRWSDGLHQAIEAKEGVPIEEENQTLATITFQNFFRMYDKLSGMTGTADTEAAEFHSIYKLDVVVIPTNKPIIRDDQEDLVYKNERGSSARSPTTSSDCHDARPAGAGRHGLGREVRGPRAHPRAAGASRTTSSTPSSTSARRRSSRRPGARARSRSRPTWPAAAPTSCSAATRRWLARADGGRSRKSPPRALEDQEAFDEAIAEATKHYKADVRTGRDARRCSTAGGLHIVGTERHESRRIDNQLRGRAGRQGDPGGVALLPVARGRPAAHLRRRPHQDADGAARHRGGRAHRARVGHQGRSRTRRRRSRAATSTSARTSSSTTT